MSTPVDLLKQIEARLEAIKPPLKAAEEREEQDILKPRFEQELRSICTLIKKTEKEIENGQWGIEIWNKLLAEAQRIMDDVSEFATGGGDDELEAAYPLLPSYADDLDDSPAFRDPFEEMGNYFGSGFIDSFLHFFKDLDPTLVHRLPRIPLYDPALKPHPLTSKIARFRDYSAPLARSFVGGGPKALSIYQARCEAELMQIPRPVGKLYIAEAEGVLATLGRSGWKERNPAVSLFEISDGELDMPAEPELGFHGLAVDCLLDGPNRLLVAGDKGEKSRVKIMKWSPDGIHRTLNLHTLASGVCQGPMAMMGNNLIRAGKGAARVWNLATTSTHGPKGTNQIGRRMDVSDTWRDDESEIEPSSGSKHDTVLRYADELTAYEPVLWTPAPTFTASTLLSSDGSPNLHTASVLAIDIESSSQTAGRYLGHSNLVTDINMTVGDGNTFITASADGYARLFDKRHPLPVFTVETMQSYSCSNAALSITPDGLPLIITDRTQSIKVWDLRARSMLYELATGNNTVTSMAWDDKNSTLYATLDCTYLSPNGYYMDYRRYREPVAPKPKARDEEEEEEEDEGEDDEMDEDDEGDEGEEGEGEEGEESGGIPEFDDRYADSRVDPSYTGRCWPRNASHGEGYWEETYDAARHGLALFRFKENPDVELYPVDGDATLEPHHW